jgi:hypothetical protein
MKGAMKSIMACLEALLNKRPMIIETKHMALNLTKIVGAVLQNDKPNIAITPSKSHKSKKKYFFIKYLVVL